MNADLRVAIACALLLFSVLLAMVTSGVVSPVPSQARDLRVRRWRWAPVTTLIAALASTALLPEWQHRGLTAVAAALALWALRTRPVPAAGAVGRHAAPAWDRLEPRRLALLAGALVALGAGVVLAVAAITV